MNEEPKGFWHRAWNEPRHFFLWETFLFTFFLVVTMILIATLAPAKPTVGLQNFGMVVVFCLGLGLLLGALGFVLSLIPPVRRWLEVVLRRRFFALAGILTFITLVVVEEDWRGWHAWNSFKTEWETRGEKFDWASAAPPAVPDDQNFAMSPVWIADLKRQFANEPAKAKDWYGDRIDSPEVARLEALLPISVERTNDNSSKVSRGDWRVAKMTDLKGWQEYYRQPGKNDSATEFSFPAEPQSPAADVLLALAKYDPVIDQLREDARRPESRFPIDYATEPDFEILLPHLAWLKGCASVLELRTIAELAQGGSEKALTDVHLLFRLADSIHTEPFLISHLVRMAIFQLALQPVWEGLAGHKWSDAQLVEIDRDLARYDFLADYQLAMRGERAMAVSLLDSSRQSGVWYGMDGNMHTSSQMIPRAFFYQNELNIARMHQQWTLPLVDLETRTVSPSLVKENARAVDTSLGHPGLYTIFARVVFPALSNAIKRFTQAQCAADMARVAVALERYRLVQGEFPEELDALAPKYIDKVPNDVINGQPLHYRRTDDGQFVLYSVGWNETDDGGVVVLDKGSTPGANPNQGDWVWKYPGK